MSYHGRESVTPKTPVILGQTGRQPGQERRRGKQKRKADGITQRPSWRCSCRSSTGEARGGFTLWPLKEVIDEYKRQGERSKREKEARRFISEEKNVEKA